MSSLPTTIAVIGYGRFGKFVVDLVLLHTDFNVIVISSKPQARRERVSFGSTEDIKIANVVIPTVPISAFEQTVQEIAPHLQQDCVVIDVCSVKSYPVEIMLKHLPSSVSILATHPMFGPSSYERNNGLRDLPIALHPVRIDNTRYELIKQRLTELGLKALDLDPDSHDKYVATSQVYTFLVGKLTGKMKLQTTPIDTYWQRLLLDLSHSVQSDGEELFKNMIKYNKYAEPFLELFKENAGQLIQELENI